MTHYFKSLSLTAALLLGACGHYSEDLASLDQQYLKTETVVVASSSDPASLENIAPAAGGSFVIATNTKALTEHLAREYYALAKHENNTAFDYRAAKLFTDKALSASKGAAVAPSRVESFDIPKDKVAELNEARSDLLIALKNGYMGGYEQQLANAQTNYDCWLERVEESSKEDHYASCKEGYQQAMMQLVIPAAGEASAGVAGTMMPTNIASASNMYEIAFAGVGDDMVDATAAAIIAQAANFMKSPEGAGYKAIITGYTADTAERTRIVATSRALRVREMLMSNGIPSEAIRPQIAPVKQPADIANYAEQIVNLGKKVHIHLMPPVVPTAPYTATH
jgi:outer membrane protein OmpA-like peptidoglycan-associated protein